jgi:hypothetical protein
MISPHLSFAHGEAYRAELRRQAERYRTARRLRLQARFARQAERYRRARLLSMQARLIRGHGEGNVRHNDETTDAAA